MVDDAPTPRDTKKPAPLAWILIAIVLGVIAIAIFGPSHRIVTPSGGTAAAVGPAAGAPPTPGSGGS